MKVAHILVATILVATVFSVWLVSPTPQASKEPFRTFAVPATSLVWWVGASSTDSSALPNTGVQGVIQVMSTSVSASSCLAFWVSDDLSNNYWGQVGYYICGSTVPFAFYQIWNLNNMSVLASGSTSVSTGDHRFSMYLQSGTTWVYSLDGVVFGTYNMGASSSSSSYPVYALSEEEAGSVFSFPTVTFSTAMQVLKSGTWSPVQTAESYGTEWGVQGAFQNGGLPSDQIAVGGSLAAIAQGTALWNSGSTSTTSSSSTASSTTSSMTLPPVTMTSTTSTATQTVTSTQTVSQITTQTSASTSIQTVTTIAATTSTPPTSTSTTSSSSTSTDPPSTLTVMCNPTSVVVSSATTCKATVHESDTKAPTGTVTWSSNGSGRFSKTSCKLSKHKTYSTCSVRYTPTAAGSVIVTASYGGDLKNPATDGAYNLVVTMKTSRTTVSCTPRSAVAGSSTIITCKAKVIGYLPTGTVSWSQSGTGSVSFTSTTCILTSLKNHNQATCSVTMTGTTAGKVTLQGTYNADPNNLGSYKTAKLTIKPATTARL